MTRWVLRIAGIGIIGSYLIIPTFFKSNVTNHSLEHRMIHTLGSIQSSETPFTDDQWNQITRVIEHDREMKSKGFDNWAVIQEVVSYLFYTHLTIGLLLIICSFLPFTKNSSRTKPL